TSGLPSFVGSATAGAGGAALGRGLGAACEPEVLRFPNTPTTPNQLSLASLEFFEDWCEQAGARTFHLAAPGQHLRELLEGFRNAVTGGDFRDHLSVIGGGAEQLRFEPDDRRRLGLESLGEIRRFDFWPLGHANQIETIMRAAIIRPRGL